MIRLLMSAILIATIFLFFSFVSSHDIDIKIQLLDYYVNISGFFLGLLAFTTCIGIAFVIKVVAIVINLPSIISSKIKTSKAQHIIKQVMDAYAMALSDKKESAYKIIGAIKNELPPELATHLHLILSATDQNSEQRTHHLRYLLDHSEYRGFAAKELTKYFAKHRYWKQALDYLEQAMLCRPDDPELLKTAFKVYAEMLIWDKFEDAVVRLEKLDPISFSSSSKDIANYYFAAAKDVIASGEDNKAIQYLEKCLTHKVDFLEAVSLLCSLLANSSNNNRVQKFLSDAFTASPSFELFELYVNSSNAQHKEIYDELALFADPKKHIGLFISIAVCLDLKDTARELIDFRSIDMEGS